MRILMLLLSNLAVLLALQGLVSAQTLRVVDDEWLWFSSNLTEVRHSIDSKSNKTIDHHDARLGDFTYDKYFERQGQPPAHDFLQTLIKDPPGVTIDGKDIVFFKTGIRKPLKTDLVPSDADPALPRLMGIPDTDTVFVVYPYYFYGCKDNDHIVELYSIDGSLLHQFDSLPTHAVRNNPELLVSPERSGCCDSLKWSMRFYDLKTGNVSVYGCPEGACGDMLFVKIGQDGPFLVGLELIGFLTGIGASLQTNIYIVNADGSLLASGKIIYSIRSLSINKRIIQDISPFSISKLSSLEPGKDNGKSPWYLEFQDGDNRISLELIGNVKDPTPAVVFFIPKETARKEIIEFNSQEIGTLPTIGICESGSYTLSGKTSKMMNRIRIQSDTINKIIF